MKLSDYEWSHNPRGMHNQGYLEVSQMKSQNMGIAKLVGVRDDYISLGQEYMANGITPIIRIYRAQFSGLAMDSQLEREFRNYLQGGLKWFEFYNEPNLSIEWHPGANYDPYNTEGVMKPICDNWLNWAEMIVSYGAYPGFLALSDAGGGWENTTTWINQSCLYMYENHFNRFLTILNNGFWLATHPYIVNHFYQEMPGGAPTSARPPEMQNYAEPGWHFEYPYDPISQASDPGRTVWGETPQVPLGDVHGVIGCGLAWLDRLQELFGVGAVPVIGTEGGLSPLPERNQIMRMDSRYPGFSWESHAHGTVAMFDWIVNQAPPWMFGVALWKADHYYTAEGGGPYPAATLMAQTKPGYKEVPPIEAIGDYDLRLRAGRLGQQEVELAPPPEIIEITVEPPGPGPLHGSPTHHFVIPAPGTGEEWFFEVGQAYFDRFQPTLMTYYDFINFLPRTTSLAVTIITPPHMVDLMNREISRRWINVYVDMITAEEVQQVQEILNSRVAVGRSFG